MRRAAEQSPEPLSEFGSERSVDYLCGWSGTWSRNLAALVARKPRRSPDSQPEPFETDLFDGGSRRVSSEPNRLWTTRKSEFGTELILGIWAGARHGPADSEHDPGPNSTHLEHGPDQFD
jgi:hypothetical protein